MTRLMIAMAALALLPLTACGSASPPATPSDVAPASAPVSTAAAAAGAQGAIAAASAKLARLETRYRNARAFVDLLILPFASTPRAAQIRDIENRIDRAFAAARTAKSLAEQLAQLARAEGALADLDAPN